MISEGDQDLSHTISSEESTITDGEVEVNHSFGEQTEEHLINATINTLIGSLPGAGCSGVGKNVSG